MRKLFLLLFLISSFTSIGQEPMRVLRSDAVSYSSDVINIHVTQENVTYVATERGVFRIYDVNLGEPLVLEPSEESLLAYPGGNALISWEKGALDKAMGAVLSQDNQVTTTYYDADKDELWVGTTETGIFVLTTKPRLSLKRTLDNRNSRLRSNYINTIHRDFRGTFWIGTQYGVLKGKENRWELLERDFNIESIATDSSDVWFLGSNLVGYVDRKGVWYPIELPRRATEGRLKEVAIDQDGQIWIASEVITRYDPELDEFSSYGPATYYTSQYASTLRINQDSALWVGTEDKGLYLIEKASAMTVSLLVERDLSCAADDPGGVLEARVKGGREPYQYKWSVPAFTGSTADQLQPGIFTVEVTDAGGKKKTATAELLDPRLSLTLELQEAESEPNAADGRAKVNVTGGQPGYRYAWDNGETLGVASKLKGGVHRVTVTDTKGCSEVGTINIPQDAAELIVDIEAIQKPACSGLMTGALQANVSGGRMPYTYEWSTGKKSPGISQIGEGTYQVTITDAVGTTQMATLLLIAPLPIVVESTIVSPASTNQFNGQANLAISGGVEPYAIRWDNGDETEQTSRLGGGKHTVTVTDGNGCTIVSDVLVPEDILPIQAQIEDIQPISCPGAVDGSLLLSVTGGKPPYSYSWNTPAFSGIQGDNLPAGKYTVTIVDASGQSVQTSFDLEEPEPVQAQVIPVAPATTGSNNGQAEVSVTGGQSPYQYRWDNGETEALAQQLTSGEHSVTITDKMGCTAITEISISENVLPLTLTLKQTQLLNCAEDQNAEIVVEINGGKPPFKYFWDNGITDPKLQGLAPGRYAVTVTDEKRTRKSAEILITAPDALMASARVVAPASTNNADGQAEVIIQGGVAPYTIAWDNGETTPEANQLAPGLHLVSVQDANGCGSTAEVSIDENVLPLTIAVDQTQEVQCAGERTGQLQLTVRGGKSPFDILWNTGDNETTLGEIGAGSYEVTVKDQNGTSQSASINVKEPIVLMGRTTVERPASVDGNDGQASVFVTGGTRPYTYNWSNGQASAKADGFAAGSHQVTVTDANGCETKAEVNISENILPLRVTIAETKPLTCADNQDGQVRASVVGGKRPFVYSWSNGTNGESVSGLAAGAYVVTVTDGAGSEQTATITVTAPEPLAITTTVDRPASTNGSDGQASIKVSGGTTPYTYLWDNGSADTKASGLTPGVHEITVTDANGCEMVAELNIPENILPLQVTLETLSSISCANGQDGQIGVQLSGGKGPFDYLWSTGVKTETLENLSTGEYMLTVTDALGTSQRAKIVLAEPQILSINLQAIQPASTDGSDGQATVSVVGGTPPYSLDWDSGETEETAIALRPGVHMVTVTDANGCSISGSIEITENILPLSLSVEVLQPISCNGVSDGALSTVVKGGKAPYLFDWGETTSGEAPTGLAPGTYTVTVTDNSGQKQEASIVLSQPDALQVSLSAVTPSSGGTDADGKATLSISGGTPDYSVRWSSGESSLAATQLDIGDQNVVVVDARGCQIQYDLIIKERMIPGLVAEQVEEGQTLQMEALRFEADSITVNDGMLPILEELYQFLNANQEIKVEIGGHTNNIPPDFYCDQLSTSRAKAVADYLTNKGISSNQVSYRGYGKRQPIAPNDTPEGRSKNQRVEIKILDGLR